MKFEEFKANVEQWARTRGIYEYSTPTAQLMKTISEAGELADAIIKDDGQGTVDAIGDVTVCLVNYCYMTDIRTLHIPRNHTYIESHSSLWKSDAEQLAATVAYRVSEVVAFGKTPKVQSIIKCLVQLAAGYGTTLEACCEAAWNEIKDRKGHMSASGAFVKEV